MSSRSNIDTYNAHFRYICNDSASPRVAGYAMLPQKMTPQEIHTFITTRILLRLAHAGARREEALREILRVSHPMLDDAAIARLTAMVPELPSRMYEKWATLFADRLLETIPETQLAELCRNTEESNSALMLVYSMFMESERMEKVVAEDLESLSGDIPMDEEQTALIISLLQKGCDPVVH